MFEIRDCGSFAPDLRFVFQSFKKVTLIDGATLAEVFRLDEAALS